MRPYMLPTRVHWSLYVLACMLIDLCCTALYSTVLYWTCMCQYNVSVHLLIHALLSSSSTCASLYMLPSWLHWSLCVLTCLLIDLYCTALYSAELYCTVLYCTVLCCTVLYCTMLYCTVVYYAVLYLYSPIVKFYYMCVPLYASN